MLITTESSLHFYKLPFFSGASSQAARTRSLSEEVAITILGRDTEVRGKAVYSH